jgi:ribulose-5-phosphate 4-epimerase/fuculose-1-phosphate aldolase
MTKLELLLEEIVTANRILAREGVVDSFGHVSARHPDNPQRFLLSRARAPDCIEVERHTVRGDRRQTQAAPAHVRQYRP